MVKASSGGHSGLFARLIVYAIVLAAVMAVFHIVVASIGGGMVDQWAALALALAALVIVIGALILRSTLTTLPFAFFVFHVISYVLVAGSVAVHAFLADWAGTGGGGLVWMIALWSAGLLLHAFASVARRGFADADA